MSRKLATIRQISNIQPIEGADMIELATVDGWNVVVAKDVGHKINDFVVYCEVDSFLPIKPEFEFLRKTSYKKMGEVEGFRLKTIRLRGVLSQGLILPITVLDGLLDWGPYIADYEIIEQCCKEGIDMSNVLGIVKYEPPIPAELAGVMKGNFPSFIPRTDEERVQNLTKEYEQWKRGNVLFVETEKLDGSSATFYLNDGEFGVCSRNLELIETEGNTFWKVARELKIEEKLRAAGGNFAIQGELLGEGIQKNRYKLKGQTVKFFTAFNIDTSSRLSPLAFEEFIIEKLQLDTVPFIFDDFELPNTVDELLEYVNGKSELMDTSREGSVFRSVDGNISFKVISNEFLLKDKE